MKGKKAILMAAACLVLTSCQGKPKEEDKSSIRIGISLYRGDDTFINNIRSVVEEKAKEYDELQGSAETAARRGYVDLIIDPADTRKYLINAFELLYTKCAGVPDRKHGTK